jgi:hypothetical protein
MKDMERSSKILIYIPKETRQKLDEKVQHGYKISSLVRLFIIEGLKRMDSGARFKEAR